MEILILAAAKPSLGYAREGVRFFEERLRPLGRVELRYVKAGRSEEVSERLLEASRGCLALRESCDAVISLGRHTMQHELALVVLLEQIYRVHTLLAGSPYHRD